MNTKTAFLLLNGEAPIKLPDLSKYNIICATDGAYNYFKKENITPNFISGDFDSLLNIPESIETFHTPNQNYTDFDKIIKILHSKGYTTIEVFGASGKEQDHFLGNLHTAIQWKNKVKLKFIDNYSTYFLADKKVILKKCRQKTISLVPFPTAKNITTSGLKYPLKNETLIYGSRIGTRNKAVEDIVEINFESGEMFIFVQH